MVTRKFGIVALAALALLAGCNSSPAPQNPVNGSRLVLKAPVPEGISPQFTLAIALAYRVASGSEVFSGSVSVSDLASTAGPLNIPLPHDGPWLVSAEWINLGTVPLYIGADAVTVSGNTPFDLALGNLNQTCYHADLANPGSNAGYPDLLTFDTAVTAYSPVAGADVQCLLGGGANPSVYLQGAAGPAPQFAYLGTGNWVDFTAIPSGTTFRNDSLAAKRAVLGPLAVTEVNDVYAIKLSSTNTAWIQVDQVVNVGATYMSFFFRLNRHGYPYLKFDVTSFGDANCNNSGVSRY